MEGGSVRPSPRAGQNPDKCFAGGRVMDWDSEINAVLQDKDVDDIWPILHEYIEQVYGWPGGDLEDAVDRILETVLARLHNEPKEAMWRAFRLGAGWAELARRMP